MSFKNIKDGWLNYITSIMSRKKLPPAIQQMAEDRAKICGDCPELHMVTRSDGVPVRGRCKKCGCIFPAMVFAPGKRCPLGKWDAKK